MKQKMIDGRECLFFLERIDGEPGLVLATYVLQDDGTYHSFREHWDDEVPARAAYARLEGTDAEQRCNRALRGGVSGKRIRGL